MESMDNTPLYGPRTNCLFMKKKCNGRTVASKKRKQLCQKKNLKHPAVDCAQVIKKVPVGECPVNPCYQLLLLSQFKVPGLRRVK